jgi:hypothetical protein
MDWINILKELMPILIEILPIILDCFDGMEPKRKDAVLRYISTERGMAKFGAVLIEATTTGSPEGQRARLVDALEKISNG